MLRRFQTTVIHRHLALPVLALNAGGSSSSSSSQGNLLIGSNQQLQRCALTTGTTVCLAAKKPVKPQAAAKAKKVTAKSKTTAAAVKSKTTAAPVKSKTTAAAVKTTPPAKASTKAAKSPSKTKKKKVSPKSKKNTGPGPTPGRKVTKDAVKKRVAKRKAEALPPPPEDVSLARRIARNKAVAEADDMMLTVEQVDKIKKVFKKMAEVRSIQGDSFRAIAYDQAVNALTGALVKAKNLDNSNPSQAFKLSDLAGAPTVGTPNFIEKIREIVKTGTMTDLETQMQKPIIRSAMFIAGVVGFGPKAAVRISNRYVAAETPDTKESTATAKSGKKGNKAAPEGAKSIHELASPQFDTQTSGGEITSVAQLQALEDKGCETFTAMQRVGLKYYEDLKERIPHEEGKEHEKIVKDTFKKVDSNLQIDICGSYRRKLPTSGDIDVLVTWKDPSKIPTDEKDDAKEGKAKKKTKGKKKEGKAVETTSSESRPLKGGHILPQVVQQLKESGYIIDEMSGGESKFMGFCRLPSKDGSKKQNRARRLDIRFVDPAHYPFMLLYFTGSASFNVRMRQHAIAHGLKLNEYGLFDAKGTRIDAKSEEEICKIMRFPYYKPEERSA